MSETPKNLSGAIKRAREMHRDEIAERLRRRREAEQERLDQLNAVPREAPAPAKAPEPPSAEPAPVTVAVPAAPVVERTEPEVPEPEPVEPPRVETLPTERFLKVRNTVFDELARYLGGNRYKVYMEVYRETLGRRQPTPAGFFRPREMARELGIGSDQTVYRALKELESAGLITCEARVGDTRGTKITIHAVDPVIEKLRAQISSKRQAKKITTVKITTVKNTVVDQQSSLRYDSENHHGSVVKITTLHDHERHERHGNTPSRQARRARGDDGGSERSERDRLVEQLVARYAYSPHLARTALGAVAPTDLDLVPFLLTRLDAAIERGQLHRGAVIQNPPGVLSGWLADFDSWRAVLEADRDRATSGADDRPADTGTDLFTEYLAEMDADAERRIDALGPDERARLDGTARDEISTTFPASADWPEEHWKRAILAHLKRSHFERPSFEDWQKGRTDAQ